ncbi:MAG: hypothetical protein AB1458_01205 [Bacteroidota bacterium]
MRLKQVVTFVAVLALAACRDNKVDCDTVTYSGTIVPIIANNCMNPGCHGSGSANGDYTTYAGVKAKVDNGSFQHRVIDKKDMPPGGLGKDDMNKIKCWLDAGAPNN